MNLAPFDPAGAFEVGDGEQRGGKSGKSALSGDAAAPRRMAECSQGGTARDGEDSQVLTIAVPASRHSYPDPARFRAPGPDVPEPGPAGRGTIGVETGNGAARYVAMDGDRHARPPPLRPGNEPRQLVLLLFPRGQSQRPAEDAKH